MGLPGFTCLQRIPCIELLVQVVLHRPKIVIAGGGQTPYHALFPRLLTKVNIESTDGTRQVGLIDSFLSCAWSALEGGARCRSLNCRSFNRGVTCQMRLASLATTLPDIFWTVDSKLGPSLLVSQRKKN